MTRLSASRMDMQGGRVDNSNFKQYGETLVGGAAGTNTTASYVVDLSLGNVFNLILNANCSFSFANPAASGIETSFTLLLKQSSTGGFTPTWPAAVVWPGGIKAFFSMLPNNIAVFTFYTLDGGSRWFGSAQNSVYNTNTLFGFGNAGVIGINNGTVGRSSPVQVAGTNWSQVSSGMTHTLAIRTDGTMWAWGGGTFGQFGNNTTLTVSSPVQIAGTAWAQASAGGYSNSSAIRTDGTLWAWGSNPSGQLGINGSTVGRSSPVQVAGTSWAQVATGISHMIAVRTDGTLWTWGNNTLGQLGDNSSATVTKSSPVQIAGTNWAQVAAGANISAAIRTDGTLWTWGFGTLGRLGNNNTVNMSSPVQVAGTTWARVASGGSASAGAIRTDGTLWMWGNATSGQIGNQNITSNQSSPVQVAGTNWANVAPGTNFTAAIRTDGTLWTWGINTYGELGNNSSGTVSRSSPVQVAGTSWAQVTAGQVSTEAIQSVL